MLSLKTFSGSLSATRNENDILSSLPDGNLYAILDACDEPQVLSKVCVLGSRCISLYSGQSAERFQDIAPYLVNVDRDLLAWIDSNLSGKPWGLFLSSSQSLSEVRKHLRKFLMVDLDGRSVYFRFYDPRIMPAFLKSTSERELKEFFGPIERFIVPTSETEQLLELAWCEQVM